MVSIADKETRKAIGALLVESLGDVSVLALGVDPNGVDVEKLEINKFYTKSELQALGYEPYSVNG